LTVSAKSWASRLAPYRQSDNRRAVFELLLTVSAFVACWLAVYATLRLNHWLLPIPVVLAAGFVVRLFMLQHDCGHLSMFTNRRANDWVGRVLGVFTFTPYDYWRHAHAMHHAGSGNLDRRGMVDWPIVSTETLSSCLALVLSISLCSASVCRLSVSSRARPLGSVF